MSRRRGRTIHGRKAGRAKVARALADDRQWLTDDELQRQVEGVVPPTMPDPNAMTRERYEELVRETLAGTDVDVDAYLRGELGDAGNLIADALGGKTALEHGIVPLQFAPVGLADPHPGWWTGDATPTALVGELAGHLAGREAWEEAVLARYREMFAAQQAAQQQYEERMAKVVEHDGAFQLRAMLDRASNLLAAQMEMTGEVTMTSTENQGESTEIRPPVSDAEVGAMARAQAGVNRARGRGQLTEADEFSDRANGW